MLAKAIQALKISLARRAMNYRAERAVAFWQKRYYDHNVCTHQSFVEKLRSIHRNPGAPGKPGSGLLGWKSVKRGLVEKPEDWK